MQIGTAQACLWGRRREVAAFWDELVRRKTHQRVTYNGGNPRAWGFFISKEGDHSKAKGNAVE